MSQGERREIREFFPKEKSVFHHKEKEPPSKQERVPRSEKKEGRERREEGESGEGREKGRVKKGSGKEREGQEGMQL